MVIHDADRTLAAWLDGVLPAGVTVTFETPEPSWAQRAPRLPFVNAFLCDIREDAAGVSADTSPVRAPNGSVIGRRPAVRRYRLSFLLTAWAAETTAGHELLGSIMAACAAADVIPPDCLHGTLAAAGSPVALQCAPDELAVSPLQLWQALGVPPRTAVILVMTVPLVPEPRTGLAPPARQLDLDVTSQGGGERGGGEHSGGEHSGGEHSGGERAGGGERSGARPGQRWERGRITERHS